MQDELRESHFAAVVIGTGLVQSIAAAALSAAGRPIIHIDEHAAYGGPHASLSLAELEHNVEYIHIDDSLVSRQYSISLVPHLVPATGPFVAALVNSGVSRYGSFCLCKRIAVAQSTHFRTVPSNKQDVFRDKSVSLVQKRRLIKFLVFCSGDFESEIQGKESSPLLELARSTFGLDDNLAEALAYAVAFCTSPNDPALPALVRTRAYLASVGRYGPSPFLIGHYGGAGELAQGFCRTCAVMGGTYVLGRKVLDITRNQPHTHREWTTASGEKLQTYHPPSTFEGYGVEGVDASAQDSTTQAQDAPQGPLFRIQLEGFAAPFTSDVLIAPETWLQRTLDGDSNTAEDDKPTHTIRGVVIIDSPDSFAFEQSGNEAQDTKPTLGETLLVFPPREGTNTSVVTVLANGAGTMSCPDGKCVLYFTTDTPTVDDSPRAYFEPFVQAVLDGCTPPRPQIRAEIYWREKHAEQIVVRKAGQDTAATATTATNAEYTTMHLTQGADAAAHEAERVFWDVIGEVPGEDGKSPSGVEFFARVERAEDAFDDF